MRFARLVVPATVVLSVSGLGCSDPVPPTPQGAYAATFIDPGIDCNSAGHNITMGEVTPDTKDKLLKNGEDGAEISCSVTGSGSFDVSAKGFRSSSFLKIDVKGLKSKGNGGPTADNPAPGAVTFASANTAGNTYGSTPDAPCDFWFFEDTNQDVAAGRAWLTFSCGAIVLDENSTCQLSTSYAIFENCAGAAEAD
ncbi:MAG: hypothetical protein WKG00_01400 [Polyangiaceae bacterium]